MRRLPLLCLLLGLASPLWATTYYVDPATGSDDNNGTATGTPWASIPGSRNTANTAFLSSGSWGAIDGTVGHRITCGDTVLLKGGASAGAANTYSTSAPSGAGGLCIASSNPNGNSCQNSAPNNPLYTAGCSDASPITIRIATNAEWTGSNGDFVINCAGMTPKGLAYATDFDPCVAVYNVPGLKLLGQGTTGVSTTQTLRITALNPGTGIHKGGIDVSGGGSDFEIGFARVDHHARGPGISMGDIQHSVVHDVELDNNGAPGFNCGLGIAHNCNGVGVRYANIHDNALIEGTGGSPDICASFGESVEIQGAQRFYLLDSQVTNGHCTGMNVGAGNHLYTYDNFDLVRDVQFRGNGIFLTFNSSKTGYEGGGDSVPAEGAPAGTPRDAYAMLQRVVFWGQISGGPYVHHGSGFSLFINTTTLGNCVGGSPWCQSHYQWNQVAGDNGLANSILVHNDGTATTVARSNSGCAGGNDGVPVSCKVCDQRCSNPGVLCTSDAQCTGCTAGGQATCGQYNPKPVFTHNILVGQSATSEGLSDFKFVCGTNCANAGTDCYSGSECTGCTGATAAASCRYSGGSGSTFAAPPKWISRDASNLLGAVGGSNDPLFTAAPANCLNGVDFATCNLRLDNALSPAIDAGTFYMLAAASSSGATISVKQNPALVALGLNWNGKLGDPNFWFIYPEAYLGAVGDVIQIDGATCANAVADFGNAERARIVSMTTPGAANPTITVDRACAGVGTNAGIALAYEGNAPDIGAYETTGSAATTTSTSSSTSSTGTATTSSSTSTSTSTTSTSTTSTVPPVAGYVLKFQGQITIQGGVNAQ